MRVPELAADVGAPLRPRAGRRVPGHQRAAGLDPARAQAGWRRADRGRRRRAGHLRLPRRHRAQHPGFPEPVPAAGRDRARWSRTTARPSRSSPPATPSSGWPASSSPRTCARTAARARGRRWSRSQDDIGQVDLRGRDRAGEPRGRHGAQGAGGAVPHLAPQRHARDRAHPPQHPLRQVRRPQVHRGRARQGHAGGAALGREPGRPRDRLSRPAAAAGARPRNRRQGPRSPWPGDRPSMRWPPSARPPRRPSIGASWSR